ncbi:hypothetical protein MSAN_01832600 [Mycena sanguinolenta]|uniref:Uncharacterized protein n=1 Tax=Mycena sanguinolenta TaxID=230812 RepID=A0A8H6XQC9_9AGAR|nr:hypothetical protein MSAN_01832600 [Mycena sanguinolenta]
MNPRRTAQTLPRTAETRHTMSVTRSRDTTQFQRGIDASTVDARGRTSVRAVSRRNAAPVGTAHNPTASNAPATNPARQVIPVNGVPGEDASVRARAVSGEKNTGAILALEVVALK